jgi:polar amino acid transport system substrate-binding protein
MKQSLIVPMIALAVLGLMLAGAGCTSGTSQTSASPAVSAQPGQDNHSTPASSVAPATTQKKTLVVGIDGEYTPFSYLDSSGNPTGFDVESMKWIAQKKGFDVKFQPVAWDGIIPALQAGKVDLIYSGMTITPERAEQVNFSSPYWVVNQDVVARNDSKITIDDVKAGKAIIGAQSGCTAAIWVDKNLISTNKMPQDQLKLYANTPLALDDLVAGRIDAVMYDDHILKTMIAGKPVRTIGNIPTKEEYGVAVRKANPELLATMNDGLTQLQADPYWQELITRYKMK